MLILRHSVVARLPSEPLRKSQKVFFESLVNHAVYSSLTFTTASAMHPPEQRQFAPRRRCWEATFVGRSRSSDLKGIWGKETKSSSSGNLTLRRTMQRDRLFDRQQRIPFGVGVQSIVPRDNQAVKRPRNQNGREGLVIKSIHPSLLLHLPADAPKKLRTIFMIEQGLSYAIVSYVDNFI